MAEYQRGVVLIPAHSDRFVITHNSKRSSSVLEYTLIESIANQAANTIMGSHVAIGTDWRCLRRPVQSKSTDVILYTRSTLVKQPTQARHSRTFRRLLAALALLLLGAGWLAPQRAAAAPAPVALGFKGGAGGILDTGFTTTLPGTTQQSGNLLLTPANLGILQITSTGGDLASSTTQDNALAIQYSSSGAYTIQARMLAPIAFATSFQSGGIFIGLSNSSYIRLTAGVGSKRSNGERIQLDVADNNGKARSSTVALPAGTLARVQASLYLFKTI